MATVDVVVLGGHGFIGSAIVEAVRQQGRTVRPVGREDYAAAVDTVCGTLINANGNSRKYMADRDPAFDFDASVRSVAGSLHDFRFDRYIQLSTMDVYAAKDDPTNNGEQTPIEPLRLSRYGHHKWLAEELIRFNAATWLIVRMGGFVGPGLRKNSIYDMLKGQPPRVHPDSCYQYQHSADLARIVLELEERDAFGEIFNAAGDGLISLREVAALIPGYTLAAAAAGAARERYELNIEKIKTVCRVAPTRATVVTFIRQVLDGTERLA